MSDLSIHPAGHSPVHSIRGVPSLSHPSPNGVNRLAPAESAPPAHSGDRVELSDVARLLARMREMPEVRQDRIDQVRSALERGGYDSDARLDLAVERLIEEEDLLGS
jgi:hypothetical protein